MIIEGLLFDNQLTNSDRKPRLMWLDILSGKPENDTKPVTYRLIHNLFEPALLQTSSLHPRSSLSIRNTIELANRTHKKEKLKVLVLLTYLLKTI